MKIRFSNKCEYVKVCPFYQERPCDIYYETGTKCGIKREVDSGETWEWINLHHHKKVDAQVSENLSNFISEGLYHD